ncbi:MAG: hypothetical protein MI725_13675 [Pirellulales bacterium]|nr:hypothetical protein [Pirellulales bacterium]
MVAPRRTKKVFCTVLRVPVADNTTESTPSRFSSRPSDLIPWADPYIAQLVRNLQNEVRSARRNWSDFVRTRGVLQADLEPPCPSSTEWDWEEERRWTFRDDA